MKQLLRVIMSLLLLMYCAGAMAQTLDVSGKVIDEQGEPVIGASVVQKGTSNGTVTDIDGNFTFKAPQGATLVVSYVGYKNVEVKADEQTTDSITDMDEFYKKAALEVAIAEQEDISEELDMEIEENKAVINENKAVINENKAAIR